MAVPSPEQINQLFKDGRIDQSTKDQMMAQAQPSITQQLADPFNTTAVQSDDSLPVPKAAQPVVEEALDDSTRPLTPFPSNGVETGMPASPFAPAQSTTTEVTSGKEYTPGTVNALNKVYDTTQKLLIEKGELEAANTRLAKEHTEADAARWKEYNDKEQATRTAVQLDADKRQKELDAQIADFQSSSVDPNHLWASSSTGNKIAAGVALALGALGAGFTGTGENKAVAVIQNAIERDIDTQKANMSKKGEAANQARGAYAEFLRKTGSEEVARLATFKLGLDMAEKQFQAVIASNAGELVKKNAEINIQALKQEQAKTNVELGARTFQKSEETIQGSTKAGKGLDNLPTPISERLVATEAAVDELQESRSAYQDYIKTHGKGPNAPQQAVNAFLKKIGIDSKDADEVMAATVNYYLDKRRKVTGSAASKEEDALIRSTVPNPFQNPQGFLDFIDRETQQNLSEAERTRKAYAGKYDLPNPTIDYNAAKNDIKYNP